MHKTLLILLSVFGAGAKSPAQTMPPSAIYGTFSSYAFVEESGDIVGFEVVILPGFRQPQAVFQCSEGAPGEAVLAAVTIRGTELEFDIPPANMCGGSYKATVTRAGLRLWGARLAKPTLLPRRKSFWASHPAATLK